MTVFYSTLADLIASTSPGSGEDNMAQVGNALYVFDSTNTDAPNQMTCICPTDKSTQTTENGVDTTGGATLSNTKVLFNTATLSDTADSRYDATDLQLHGHQVGSRSTPYFIHATGVIASISDRTYDITYRYASAAGRWLRVFPHHAMVSPSWLGATGTASGTGTGTDEYNDESDLLCWTMYFASLLTRHVLLDKEYCFTRPLCIYDGQMLLGRSRHKDGLYVDLETVLSRFRTDLGNIDADEGADYLIRQVTNSDFPCVIPVSGASTFRVRDLQIDGGVAEFDFDVYDGAEWNEANAFAKLKGNYACHGLSVCDDNSHTITGIKCEIRDVYIHDVAGACITVDPDGDNGIAENSFYRHIWLKNSVAHRHVNGMLGDVANIYHEGYFAKELAAFQAPFTCMSWIYETAGTHPRSSQQDLSGVAVKQIRGEGSLVDMRDGRKPFVWVMHGITAQMDDVTGLNYFLELSHECDVLGSLSSIKPAIVGSGWAGALERVKIQLASKSGPGFKGWQAGANTGVFNDLELYLVNTIARDDYQWPDPLVGTGTGDEEDWDLVNQANWINLLDDGLEFRVGRGTGQTDEHQQILKIRYDTDYYHGHIITLEDLDNLIATGTGSGTGSLSDDITLVDVILTGRVWNRFPRLFHGTSVETDNGDYDAIADELEGRVRIFFDNLTFYMLPAGQSGWNNQYDDQFRMVRMRKCKTHDGYVSEQNGTAVWSSGASIPVSTSLLWKPRQVIITPITDLAAQYYDGYEWTGITDDGMDTMDARGPGLQINLNTTPAGGSDVQFAWACAVNPW